LKVIYFNIEHLLALSKTETDREINLLIIKMAVELLKSAFFNKGKKEDSNKKKEVKFEEDIGNNYQAEIETTNNIIKNILNRFSGDPLFVLISSDLISQKLFDNELLYEIFLRILLNSNETVMKLILYNEEIQENDPLYLLSQLPFRHKYTFKGNTELIYVYLFKALDIIIYSQDKKYLSEKEYRFIEFILNNVDISQGYFEIWKNNFRFGKYIINDMTDPNMCSRCLNIIEKFFLSDTQKFILEEYYEQLQDVLHEIIEHAESVKEIIEEKFMYWIEHPKSSQIVRDGLKKLLDIFK
jgi:hypothetical protein